MFQGLTFSHGRGQQGIQGPKNPITRNETRPKCSSELLEGVNKTCTHTIKPPHRHRPQAGLKYLAHQGLILGVYSHSLVEVTYVLHRAYTTIIHGKHGLSEPLRKSPSLKLTCER